MPIVSSINPVRSIALAESVLRDLHLVKALAIAVLAIERQPGPFQSVSDQTDMKALLDGLISSHTELAFYLRAAREKLLSLRRISKPENRVRVNSQRTHLCAEPQRYVR
jgi:hypothetical protein